LDVTISSDAAFVSKLAVASVGAAAIVKYGSLGIDAFYAPSLTVALCLVFAPVLAFSLVLLRTGQVDRQ
jgi:hypothetical protein